MKATLLSLTALCWLLSAGFSAAQEPPFQESMEVFMRAKLEHSQNALEGLTTEDFKAVAKAAQELSLLSRASQWQVIQTPEYATRSSEFRREVDALRAAAEKKNLDGATLAFVKVTMNCVECHKYVRGVRQANLKLPQTDRLFGLR